MNKATIRIIFYIVATVAAFVAAASQAVLGVLDGNLSKLDYVTLSGLFSAMLIAFKAARDPKTAKSPVAPVPPSEPSDDEN